MDRIEEIRTRVKLEEHGVVNVSTAQKNSKHYRDLFARSEMNCKRINK